MTVLKNLALKPKLLISFFLVTCITGVSVTLYSIFFFSGKIEQEALRSISKSLQVAELVYANQASKIGDVAAFLGNDPALNSLALFGIKEKLQGYLQQQLQREGVHQVLVIKDKDFSPLGEARREGIKGLNAEEDFSNNLLVRKVINSGQAITSTELIPRGEAMPLLAIASAFPLIKETYGREVFGVVLIRHILNERPQLLEKIQQLLGISVFISHQRRIISAKVPPHGILPILNIDIYNTLRNTGYYQYANIRASGQLFAHKALYNEQNHMVGVLSVSISADDYVATIDEAILNYLLITLVCILIASLLGYWLAHGIVIPVRRLLFGVERMESGDLAHRIQLQQHDELGVLAAAFNTMSQQLDELFQTLKSTISTLTRTGNALSYEKKLENLLDMLVAEARSISHAEAGLLYTLDNGQLELKVIQSDSALPFRVKSQIDIRQAFLPLENSQFSLVAHVARHKKALCIEATNDEKHDITQALLSAQPLAGYRSEQALLVLPLLDRHNNALGVLELLNPLDVKTGQPAQFSESQFDIINALTSQATVAIENASGYEKIREQNTAFERFVPKEFLHLLGREQVVDIEVGDASLEEMTVLFSDIRDFTRMSERMLPDESFDFLNEYLSRIGPNIVHHGGFIDKYIGDAIMALFAGHHISSADDAVQAALGMFKGLAGLNEARAQQGKAAVHIGLGLHTGPVALGTIGFEGRLETTVIGDTVNMASRVQSLTKMYGIHFGMTAVSLHQLRKTEHLLVREIDTVQVQGKQHAHTIYDVFSADAPELQEQKAAALSVYQEMLLLYRQRQWDNALRLIKQLRHQLPEDRVLDIYQRRCEDFRQTPPPGSWQGITRLGAK